MSAELFRKYMDMIAPERRPTRESLVRDLDNIVAVRHILSAAQSEPPALHEGELIPTRRHSLRVNLDDYSLMRALLHMPAPENFTTPNHYGKVGILNFWDSLSYLDAVKKLQQFNVPFHEEPEGMTTYWDKELEKKDEQTKSCYPSNTHLQDHGTQLTIKRNLRER